MSLLLSKSSNGFPSLSRKSPCPYENLRGSATATFLPHVCDRICHNCVSPLSLVHTTPGFLQVSLHLRTWVLALPSAWDALLPPNVVKHLLLPHPHAWQMAYSHWSLPWPLSINHKPTFHLSLSCFTFLLNTHHYFNHFFYSRSDLLLSGLFPAVSPKSRPVPSTWNASNKYLLKGWTNQDHGGSR